jgi:hypothetical protein
VPGIRAQAGSGEDISEADAGPLGGGGGPGLAQQLAMARDQLATDLSDPLPGCVYPHGQSEQRNDWATCWRYPGG